MLIMPYFRSTSYHNIYGVESIIAEDQISDHSTRKVHNIFCSEEMFNAKKKKKVYGKKKKVEKEKKFNKKNLLERMIICSTQLRLRKIGSISRLL